MIRASRTWERDLRATVRRELRASPALWQEFKRRQRPTRIIPTLVPVLGLLLGATWAMSWVGQLGGTAHWQLEVALILTAAACWRAVGLRAALTDEGDRMWLAYYPLSRPDVFHRKWRRWLVHSWWPWLLSFVLHVTENGPMAAALHAIGDAVLINCLALVLPTSRYPGKVGLAGVLLLAGAIANALWFFWRWEPGTFALVLPASWPVAARQRGWWWLIPCGLLAALAVRNAQRRRREFIGEQATDVLTTPAHWSDDEDFPAPVPTVELAITPAAQHAIAERLLAGVTLSPPGPEPVGLLDRWLWRGLTPRQRELLRLMTADAGTCLARDWRNSTIAAAIGLLVGAWLPAVGASWVVGIATFISGCMLALPQHSLPHAHYPVRFWDLVWIQTKATLFQVVLWAPIPACAGALVAWKWKMTPLLGAGFGIRVAGAALLLLPVMIVSGFSGDTNDTTSPHCRGRFALSALLTAVVMIAGGVFFLFVPVRYALVGFVPATVIGWWFLWCYGRWYNQLKFDLMPVNRATF